MEVDEVDHQGIVRGTKRPPSEIDQEAQLRQEAFATLQNQQLHEPADPFFVQRQRQRQRKRQRQRQSSDVNVSNFEFYALCVS